MKKISLSLIVTLLGMIVAALRGALKLAAKIADLVDNGKADGSFEAPVWMLNVEAGLEYAQRAITCLDVAHGLAIKDAVANGEKIETETLSA